MKNSLSQLTRHPGWQSRRQILSSELKRLPLLIIGGIVAAFGFAVFQVPYNLSGGGIAGIGLIINNYTGWPVGALYFLLNLPLLVIGFRSLGRWSFVTRTLIASTFFAVFTDVFGTVMPELLSPFPPTDDILLSAVYGGILGGIGGGLIYRAGSTVGGTSIAGQLIRKRTGQPMSQTFLYTDGAILLAMGIVFGWTVTLYGLLIVFINGLASDYTLEGPSSTRVATIVTNKPEKMAAVLIEALGRGVSFWPVTGGYTGQEHAMVACTINRSQMADIKKLVAEVDPKAFVTIAVSHRALGEGFTPLL